MRSFVINQRSSRGGVDLPWIQREVFVVVTIIFEFGSLYLFYKRLERLIAKETEILAVNFMTNLSSRPSVGY